MHRFARTARFDNLVAQGQVLRRSAKPCEVPEQMGPRAYSWVSSSDIIDAGRHEWVEPARGIKNRRSNIPVLLASGYWEAAAQEAETTGVQILRKPYHIENLAAALDAAKSNLDREAATSKRAKPF